MLLPRKMSFLSMNGAITNTVISMKTSIYKIPPNLPLPKGGEMPLFGKEGKGEIF